MKFPSRKGFRKIVAGALLVALATAFSGCQTMRFYAQAVKGQYQIFAHQEPIEKLMANTNMPATLRARFELLEKLRSFADTDLKLPVDGHYTKYADLHRPFVVWNVQAAREFSMAPKTWWYPVLGKLQYRGYFFKPAASNYAAALQQDGYDVYTGGVQAYSTLGWFKDPVLNTFLFNPDADLAEIIFHELAHQRVFARGDTDFNEAFASTVGQEGTRRWLKARNDKEGLEQYLQELDANARFVDIVMATRHRLEKLFGDERTEDDKVRATDKNQNLPPEVLRREKAALYNQLRTEYAGQKELMGGHSYDRWFTNSLNNAKLNSVAAYYELVPAFTKLLEIDGGSLEKFFGSVERLSKMSRKDRRQWLATIAKTAAPGTTNQPSATNALSSSK